MIGPLERQPKLSSAPLTLRRKEEGDVVTTEGKFLVTKFDFGGSFGVSL
jgi:hypothetical protein